MFDLVNVESQGVELSKSFDLKTGEESARLCIVFEVKIDGKRRFVRCPFPIRFYNDELINGFSLEGAATLIKEVPNIPVDKQDGKIELTALPESFLKERKKDGLVRADKIKAAFNPVLSEGSKKKKK